MLCYVRYYVHYVVLICMYQSVPGPVTGLAATSGIVELTVSWTPPSEPNGVIIMYEVCTNSSGVFSYTNTSATQHTLRDLPPNTVVIFSVRAYTIIGPGEYVTGQASTVAIAWKYRFLVKINYGLLYFTTKIYITLINVSISCKLYIATIFLLFINNNILFFNNGACLHYHNIKFEWWQCYNYHKAQQAG